MKSLSIFFAIFLITNCHAPTQPDDQFLRIWIDHPTNAKHNQLCAFTSQNQLTITSDKIGNIVVGPAPFLSFTGDKHAIVVNRQEQTCHFFSILEKIIEKAHQAANMPFGKQIVDTIEFKPANEGIGGIFRHGAPPLGFVKTTFKTGESFAGAVKADGQISWVEVDGNLPVEAIILDESHNVAALIRHDVSQGAFIFEGSNGNRQILPLASSTGPVEFGDAVVSGGTTYLLAVFDFDRTHKTTIVLDLNQNKIVASHTSNWEDRFVFSPENISIKAQASYPEHSAKSACGKFLENSRAPNLVIDGTWVIKCDIHTSAATPDRHLNLPVGKPMPSPCDKDQCGRQLDFFVFEPAASPRGTVLYLHGGPWIRETKFPNDVVGQAFLERNYRLVTVNYPVSLGEPLEKYPGIDSLETLAGSILKHWKALSPHLNIEEPVFVSGTSFGGLLALHVSELDNFDGTVAFHPTLFACSVQRLNSNKAPSHVQNLYKVLYAQHGEHKECADTEDNEQSLLVRFGEARGKRVILRAAFDEALGGEAPSLSPFDIPADIIDIVTQQRAHKFNVDIAHQYISVFEEHLSAEK